MTAELSIPSGPGTGKRLLRQVWRPAFEAFSDAGKRLFLQLLLPWQHIDESGLQLAVVDEVLQAVSPLDECKGKTLRLRSIRKRLAKIEAPKLAKAAFQKALDEWPAGRSITARQLAGIAGYKDQLHKDQLHYAATVLQQLANEGKWQRRQMSGAPLCYVRRPDPA